MLNHTLFKTIVIWNQIQNQNGLTFDAKTNKNFKANIMGKYKILNLCLTQVVDKNLNKIVIFFSN